MGQVLSANHESQSAAPTFLADYTEHQKLNDQIWGEIQVYAHNETQNQIAVKEIVFYDHESYNQYVKQFSAKKFVNHPNIVQLLDFDVVRGHNLCANSFKLIYG